MEFKLATGQQKQVWSNEVVSEYVRTSGFLPYMGTSDQSIIRVARDLEGKSGNVINIPLILKLKGAGVTGAQVLSGNEDDMGNANDQIRVVYKRNAVKFTKNETFKTDLDMMAAAKPRLRNWSAESLRDEVIQSFGSVIVQGTVDTDGFSTDIQKSFATASDAEKNLHLANNADRVAFVGGSNQGNNLATSLGTIPASASGRLSASTISALKRRAKRTTNSAAAAIAPYMDDATAGRQYFVFFVDSLGFAQLQNDQQITTANTYARSREGDGMDKNPLFQGGDLIWDGVIIREVPELDTLALPGAGAGAGTVGRGFLCGLSAITVAWAQKPQMIEELEDYKFRRGIGIEEIRGVKKTSFNGVQYGVLEVYFNEVADSL